MKKDFDDRGYLREKAELARALREKAKRFLGFEGSLTSVQDQMMIDFKKSASLDHPGDKGTARENVLRAFLQSEYLPRRYGVSSGSSKVAATNGATSGQIDLALYDAMNAPRLLDVGGIHYFPVESVLGVIQVKSDLSTTDEIRNGLDNIASFKKLRCKGKNGLMDGPVGFGVLFAYTGSLLWTTIFETIKAWEKENPNTYWPNCVCVLDQALLLNLKGRFTTFRNSELQQIETPELFPVISDGAELVTFYLGLLDMLAATTLPAIPHWEYANLPMWLDGHSVRFKFGSYSQVGDCPDHGPYLKDLRDGAAGVILGACAGQTKVNSFSLMGPPVNGGAPDVFFFNPEGHPAQDALSLAEVLRLPDGPKIITGGAGVEAIEIDGHVYWVPYYYDVKLALVKHCPKCPARREIPEMTLSDWHESMQKRAENRLQELTKTAEGARKGDG